MGLECVAVGSQVKGLSFPYQATVLRCLIFTPPRLGLKLKVRTSAAIRLSRHARMMRPHVPTQQMQPSVAHHHTHMSPSGRRLPPPSTHSASCLTSYTTPLCSAEQQGQLATYTTIKVSAYPQPCSTPHIKLATHYPPLVYLSPAQHSLGGPCTQMPLKNAVESAVNLAERATGIDIDKDGDIGVTLTQP